MGSRAGSRAGSIKVAARRVGVSLFDYTAKISAGMKWCHSAKHWQPRHLFCSDSSRGDGLAATCSPCRSAWAKDRYTPKPRPAKGRRYVSARGGDKVQARGRVNYLVTAGVISDPDDLPCTDCGHATGDGTRHSYDHHLGYGPDHHESVEAVCYPCHDARTRGRGELATPARNELGEFTSG